MLVSTQVLWLSDEASPTTPSSWPSASGNQGGQSIFPSNLNTLGSSGLGKPLLTRPQHTSPDPEFATEVKLEPARGVIDSVTLVPQPVSVPQGVLRIHLVEAQNLIAKDNFMGGMVKGKSDPYVKIRVAGITYRSHTIKENLNPIWNELYEVIGLVPSSLHYDDYLYEFTVNLMGFSWFRLFWLSCLVRRFSLSCLTRILTRMTSWGGAIRHWLINSSVYLYLSYLQLFYSHYWWPPFPHRFKLSLRDIISAQFIDTVSAEQKTYRNYIILCLINTFLRCPGNSGTPWMMLSQAGFTWCWSGCPDSLTWTDWSRSDSYWLKN